MATTYRELIYMTLDELRVSSDDSFFNEEHVAWQLNRHRAYILRKIIESKRWERLAETNYQEICLDLENTLAIDGTPCEGVYLRSVKEVPLPLCDSLFSVYVEGYYTREIALISAARMRHVGHNKWLSSITYASIAPDRHLYMTGMNPQFMYLKTVKARGVFDDPLAAYDLRCCDGCGDTCDPYDLEFPLTAALIPELVKEVVAELANPTRLPYDKANDASDGLPVAGMTRKAGSDEKG